MLLQVTAENAPPVERSLPALVAFDKQLLAFGGDCAGEPTDEICMADASDFTSALAWREPALLSGAASLPSARKGMAAIYKSGTVYMFSGHVLGPKGDYEASDEMFALTVSSSGVSVDTIEQQGAFKPAPRSGATLQDHSRDCIFLAGGLDAAGAPLNDGWLFNVATRAWTCVYNGHSEGALPTGALACLQGGKLVAVCAAAGSPKLDVAAALDFEAVRAEYEFVPRMKTKAGALLHDLQVRCNDSCYCARSLAVHRLSLDVRYLTAQWNRAVALSLSSLVLQSDLLLQAHRASAAVHCERVPALISAPA